MQPELLIPLLLFVPLLGGLTLVLGPRLPESSIRSFTLGITLATFVVSMFVVKNYEWAASASAQLLSRAPWVDSFGLQFGFGLFDSVSLWLVLLTTFLMPLVVLGSWSAVGERVKEFHVWLLLLQAAMLGTFVATDILFFYICFEFTLIPLYFLIGIFGSSQRLKAARVFFLYTFTGSMLTFAGVLYVAWFNASLPTISHFGAGMWTFDIATLIDAGRRMSSSEQCWVFLALLAGFAVKVPLWPVHTWLPLAHTEAPTAGSVILAGVLLKLGTYGIYRLAIPMVPHAAVELAPVIAILAIVGILYTALVCWVQKDIKKLIAYSSVSHLGFCVLGLFAMNVAGTSGSVMYMVNHGLSTGALFLCVGMIYERLHTRAFDDFSGLGKVMPVWATFFVFFSLASVGLPGLNGFVGEFLSILGAFQSTDVLGQGSLARSAVLAGIAGTGMILGAIYILYMVGRVVFGPLKVPGGESHGGGGHHHAPTDLSVREIVTLVPLAVACVVLGVYPRLMLASLEQPSEKLVNVTKQMAHVSQDEMAVKMTFGQGLSEMTVSENRLGDR